MIGWQLSNFLSDTFLSVDFLFVNCKKNYFCFFQISFSLKQTAVNMSPLLYSDIFLTISLTSENAVKIVENKSLRFLIANGLASVTAEACQIEVVIPLDNEFENYTGVLKVRLLGHMIGEVVVNPIKDQVFFLMYCILLKISQF